MKKIAKFIFAALLFVAVLLFVRQFLIEAIIVRGTSMSPSIADNERMLVTKQTDQVARFDVVMFKAPDAPQKNYIKRVIGLPGETVVMEDDQLIIDGQSYAEPYLKPKQNKLPSTLKTNYTPDFSITVPANHYFVLGDNRQLSKDSRIFGPIAQSSLIGVGRFIIWPLERLGHLE